MSISLDQISYWLNGLRRDFANKISGDEISDHAEFLRTNEKFWSQQISMKNHQKFTPIYLFTYFRKNYIGICGLSHTLIEDLIEDKLLAESFGTRI